MRRSILLTGCIMICFCSFAMDVFGADFVVANQSQFQGALTTAASNGQNDTITVQAGTYNLSATLQFSSAENHSLTISGATLSKPVLHGGGLRRCMSASSTQANADILIENLVFQSGSTSENGGGLLCDTQAANITIENCEFNDCLTTGTNSIGGGVSCGADSGTVTVSFCIFRRNSSSGNVGGLFASTASGQVNLFDSTFENNMVTNTGGSEYYGDGGGAMLYTDSGSSVFARRNTFTSNIASGGSNPDGGGMMVYQLGTNVSATITDNTFTGNQAGLGGGGCFTRINATGTIEFHDNSFTSNTTLIGSGGGSLIYIDGGALNCTGNVFTSNHAAEDGGGEWIQHGSGSIVLSENHYRNNIADNNGGGSSIYVDTASATIGHHIYQGNSAVNVGGGLSYATTSSSLSLTRSTFYDNNADDGGGMYIYFDQNSAHFSLSELIFWADSMNEISYSSGSGTGTLSILYSDIDNGGSEPWFGTGCIETNPLFVDASMGDLHLSWADFPVVNSTQSPCIDAGNPASGQDPDGTRADMGALFFDQDPPALVPLISLEGFLLLVVFFSGVIERKSVVQTGQNISYRVREQNQRT